MAFLGPLRRAAARIEGLRPFRAPSFEHALGLELWIPPTVLPAAAFRAGPLLARAVVSALPRGADRVGRVLDVGTGSGIVGLAAARAGASVIALDINPAAVRAVQVNAMLNRVSVEVLESDLFSALLSGSSFDVIAFNPPFFESGVGGPLATALSDRPGLPILDRFLTSVRNFAAPGGSILLAGSTNGALARMRALYAAHGFTYKTVRQRERISERLVIDRLAW